MPSPLLRCSILFAALMIHGITTPHVHGRVPSGVVTTKRSAFDTYNEGFAWNVMRRPDGRGVCLSDHSLLETDGPGSGRSERGTHVEEIYRGLLARKRFVLTDPHARSATLYVLSPFMTARKTQPRFHVIVNGVSLKSRPPARQEPAWHEIPVPVALLRRGENRVVVRCDEPKGSGLELLIAREDEFPAGGGNRVLFGNTALVTSGQSAIYEEFSGEGPQEFTVGTTSERSTDGGQTWTQGALGTTNDVKGEYVIRLSLDQFRPSGALASPVIDLWEGLQTLPLITPRHTIRDLHLEFRGIQPGGTSLFWQVRFSDSRDPYGGGWTAYQSVGEGPSVLQRVDPQGKRFMQWRAILRKNQRNESPTVVSSSIRRSLAYDPQPWGPYSIIASTNPAIRYSSIHFSYEQYDEPRLDTLRTRMHLDSILVDARSDFERINRLRHAVATRWSFGSPEPMYPEWNALEILDRSERLGSGGMCQQYAVVLIQLLAAAGYQARHVNLFAHETVEVFVPDLQKWVHVDPTEQFDFYQYRTTDGLPINCLEQHGAYLEENGHSPSRPIDWKTIPYWRYQDQQASRLPLDYSSYPRRRDREPPQHRLASFVRITPRNDFLSSPWPRPAMQGRSNWPWTGYIHWYDRSTPRKKQYYLHTDRESDFYPTLGSVQFDCTATDSAGEVRVSMVTFTPNLRRFEVQIDGGDWRASESSFSWPLRPGGVNSLQMRTVNMMHVRGAPSGVRVIWHARQPGEEHLHRGRMGVNHQELDQ